MPTERDRQCAKNILAEFAHTQPPADFMEDRVANHIAAHVTTLAESNKALGEELDFLQSMMAAFQWQRINAMSEEEVTKELLEEGFTEERINAGIEKCRAMARLAIEKRAQG